MTKCGCKIVVNEKALKKYGYLGIKYEEMQIIAFCPLHSASQEMLNALKSFALHPESLGFKGIKEYSQAMIAKAESK